MAARRDSKRFERPAPQGNRSYKIYRRWQTLIDRDQAEAYRTNPENAALLKALVGFFPFLEQHYFGKLEDWPQEDQDGDDDSLREWPEQFGFFAPRGFKSGERFLFLPGTLVRSNTLVHTDLESMKICRFPQIVGAWGDQKTPDPAALTAAEQGEATKLFPMLHMSFLPHIMPEKILYGDQAVRAIAPLLPELEELENREPDPMGITRTWIERGTVGVTTLGFVEYPKRVQIQSPLPMSISQLILMAARSAKQDKNTKKSPKSFVDSLEVGGLDPFVLPQGAWRPHWRVLAPQEGANRGRRYFVWHGLWNWNVEDLFNRPGYAVMDKNGIEDYYRSENRGNRGKKHPPHRMLVVADETFIKALVCAVLGNLVNGGLSETLLEHPPPRAIISIEMETRTVIPPTHRRNDPPSEAAPPGKDEPAVEDPGTDAAENSEVAAESEALASEEDIQEAEGEQDEAPAA